MVERDRVVSVELRAPLEAPPHDGEPSGNARIEESNRFSPCEIVSGVDQLPPLGLTANFSAYPFGWIGSSQLR